MSLETQISGAVTEARKVFDLVTGQFSKWDERVKAQIKNLEDWKKSANNTYAGKNYENIFIGTKSLNITKDENGNYKNSADGAKFEAEKDTFYPVVFRDVSWYQTKTILNVNRSSVHQDNNIYGNWYGSLHLEVHYHNSYWGHGSDFCKFKHFRQSHTPNKGFIAKYNYHYIAGVIIWLRGQCTYQISANGFPYVPTVGMEKIEKIYNGNSLYKFEPIKLADITDSTQNIVIS
jgi:hypothetical protein